ncbi:carbohydrate kinase family protein [Paenibacillus piri]|uniref:Carbohydrate kinase n=1 Tax=Paenibacillus piri TaxID=2547395 RepID=A0A4R5KM39_9BACL|nr:carbohydrate kinase [Paenibacillus piri]TDF95580.1 carbohydrate kinase [Paenibacillus piri]
MPQVFTIGEALIDFIPLEKGVPLKQVNSFEKAPGGAPANVACAVAKLGGKASFIGKLGEDAFGDFLVETMRGAGVDVSYVFRTSEANTALAFVSLTLDGNRDFSFYRNPSADLLLNDEEVAHVKFGVGDILHFCSVDLIEAPVKHAHRKAIRAVKENKGIVSFDPNVRLPLWGSSEDCRNTILEFLPKAHLIKISDEELSFITGITDEVEAIASLFQGDVEHVIYTRGAQGAVWHTKTDHVLVQGHAVSALDTTGAGDAFIGALLYQLHIRNLSIYDISCQEREEIIAFANIAAAITTTKQGAISALPSGGEVSEGLSKWTEG